MNKDGWRRVDRTISILVCSAVLSGFPLFAFSEATTTPTIAMPTGRSIVEELADAQRRIEEFHKKKHRVLDGEIQEYLEREGVPPYTVIGLPSKRVEYSDDEVSALRSLIQTGTPYQRALAALKLSWRVSYDDLPFLSPLLDDPASVGEFPHVGASQFSQTFFYGKPMTVASAGDRAISAITGKTFSSHEDLDRWMKENSDPTTSFDRIRWTLHMHKNFSENVQYQACLDNLEDRPALFLRIVLLGSNSSTVDYVPSFDPSFYDARVPYKDQAIRVAREGLGADGLYRLILGQDTWPEFDPEFAQAHGRHGYEKFCDYMALWAGDLFPEDPYGRRFQDLWDRKMAEGFGNPRETLALAILTARTQPDPSPILKQAIADAPVGSYRRVLIKELMKQDLEPNWPFIRGQFWSDYLEPGGRRASNGKWVAIEILMLLRTPCDEQKRYLAELILDPRLDSINPRVCRTLHDTLIKQGIDLPIDPITAGLKFPASPGSGAGYDTLESRRLRDRQAADKYLIKAREWAGQFQAAAHGEQNRSPAN